jgi:hypothetical protein
MSTRICFWGVEFGRHVMLATSLPSLSQVSRQCGILNISQPDRSAGPIYYDSSFTSLFYVAYYNLFHNTCKYEVYFMILKPNMRSAWIGHIGKICFKNHFCLYSQRTLAYVWVAHYMKCITHPRRRLISVCLYNELDRKWTLVKILSYLLIQCSFYEHLITLKMFSYP